MKNSKSLPPERDGKTYDLMVADLGNKTVAMIHCIPAEAGDVEEIFSEYLKQKLSQE